MIGGQFDDRESTTVLSAAASRHEPPWERTAQVSAST